MAERLKVSDRTIRTYLGDPSTGAELRRLQDDRLRQVSRLALTAAESAIGVLRSVAENNMQPAGPRVAASRAILDSATRLLEVTDLAERIAALEQLLERQQPKGGTRRWA